MGVNANGGGAAKVYLGIYDKQIVLEDTDKERLEKKLTGWGCDLEHVKVRQPEKGKNEGKDLFYYVFWDVDGMLTGVTLNTGEYGEFLNIELTDMDEKFVISLGDVYGRYAKDFIRRLANLDISQKLKFGVWSQEADNGKTYSGVKMYQGGEKLEYAIAFKDLPAPKEKKRGKQKWDFSEQEEFLYDILDEFIKTNFPFREKPSKNPTQEKFEDPDEFDPPWETTTDTKEEGDHDDLPF